MKKTGFDQLGTGGRSNYEIIRDGLDKVDNDANRVDLLITVLDYDYPYDLHFEISLRTAPGYARSKVDEFLNYIDNLRDVGVRSQTETV